VDNSRFGRWLARLGSIGVALLIAAIAAAVLAPILPDHRYTRVEEGVVKSEYSNANQYHVFGMFANIGIVLVTASLGWGRGLWWRRIRLLLVLALAGLAVAMAAIAVSEERSHTYQRENSVGVKGKDDSVITSTSVSSQNSTPWVYGKLALSLAITAGAIGFVKFGWRGPGAASPPKILADADIAYSGPGNDTFADLIGVGGAAIDWPRIAGFFAAIVTAEIVPNLIQGYSITISPVIWAALLCAVAVIAFRFFRGSVAPIVAAAGFTAAWWFLSPKLNSDARLTPELSVYEVAIRFVPILAMLASLSWATWHMGPRYFALWIGAMARPIGGWVVRSVSGVETNLANSRFALQLLLDPIVFAAAMEAARRLMPKSVTPTALQTEG
jgi:hypothetical protein